MDKDTTKIIDILSKNDKTPFVQRILEREKYPVLDNKTGGSTMEYWKDKSKYKDVSTHSMSWGEADGKYYVYPTVVMDNKGSMRRLEGKDAWNNAIQTKNAIEFDNKDDAAWFSKNYKKAWDLME